MRPHIPRQQADHPRSRGVYRRSASHAHEIVGSSPLARGLPVAVNLGDVDPRIIPARAGFTCWRPRWSCASWDHPRSRGVYLVVLPSPSREEGSSPLARGLLPIAALADTIRGIIPARAGFTAPGLPAPSSRPDHPRSRGVYWARKVSQTASRGSSPLARGLQMGCTHAPDIAGIIPARAGFTSGVRCG